jgi:hypothetical protein
MTGRSSTANTPPGKNDGSGVHFCDWLKDKNKCTDSQHWLQENPDDAKECWAIAQLGIAHAQVDREDPESAGFESNTIAL